MNLATFGYNNQSVRVISIEGEPWFVASDVCSILDVSNVSHALSRLDDDEKRVLSYEEVQFLSDNPNTTRLLVVSESGAKRLISTSRKPNAILLAKHLKMTILTTRIETENILVLINAFKHLNPITQFFVNGFKIDLYFPEQQIAVECDEYDHSKYDLQKEIERQDAITKALGCQWVRFNPHDKDFCIGNVINQLIKLIYHFK